MGSAQGKTCREKYQKAAPIWLPCFGDDASQFGRLNSSIGQGVFIYDLRIGRSGGEPVVEKEGQQLQLGRCI